MAINPNMTKDPLDFQWTIVVEQEDGSITPLNGFYVDDLLPSSSGDLNSAKYVQGLLDNDFSRYPLVGNTDTSYLLFKIKQIYYINFYMFICWKYLAKKRNSFF